MDPRCACGPTDADCDRRGTAPCACGGQCGACACDGSRECECVVCGEALEPGPGWVPSSPAAREYVARMREVYR